MRRALAPGRSHTWDTTRHDPPRDCIAPLQHYAACAAGAEADPVQISGRRSACVMDPPYSRGWSRALAPGPSDGVGRQPERGQGGVPGGVGGALLIDDHFADFGA
jgi:hypothetical protein